MSKNTFMIRGVEALYPRLDQPYHFSSTGGKSGKGGTVPCAATDQGAEYSMSFKMDKAQAKELLAAMTSAYEEAREEDWPGLSMPFKKPEDGGIVGKAKIAASYKNPPKQFDAATKPLPDDFQLTTGSTVNLFVELIPYSGGMGSSVSLRLRQVQVIKLKENTQGSVFDKQEGFTQYEDSMFDAVSTDAPKEAPKEAAKEPEEPEEPKVRETKKKPPADDDLSSMLDEFDD
jgi:hypothetical protein